MATNAWLEVKEIAPNAFLFQFYSRRDEKRAVDGEPYMIHKGILVLKNLVGSHPILLGDRISDSCPLLGYDLLPSFVMETEDNLKSAKEFA